MHTSAAESIRSFGRPSTAAALIALIALAGCAAPAASSKGRSVQYLTGQAKAEAFHEANKSCNAYGRAAETVSWDGATQTLAFRCIEP